MSVAADKTKTRVVRDPAGGRVAPESILRALWTRRCYVRLGVAQQLDEGDWRAFWGDAGSVYISR